MLPGLLVSIAGMIVLADRGATIVLAGAALFGIGFGITQNATLCRMYTRVSEATYSTVSGIWNLAYDGGMGAEWSASDSSPTDRVSTRLLHHGRVDARRLVPLDHGPHRAGP